MFVYVEWYPTTYCVVFFVLFFIVLLPVSLDCPFFIPPSVFSNVYFNDIDYFFILKHISSNSDIYVFISHKQYLFLRVCLTFTI